MNPRASDMDVNYPVKIEFDEQDQLYTAEFLDLPGCSASGETVEEAYQRAQVAKQEWLRLASEQGLPIPKPSRTADYSGRFLLRLPPSLHAMLAERAKLQGASLNQYAVHLLSGAVVGDSVTTQIDQLQRKVASLELQLGHLSRSLEMSRPVMTQQPLETPVTTGSPLSGGSCYGVASYGKIQLGQADLDWADTLDVDICDWSLRTYPFRSAGAAKLAPKEGWVRGDE